MSRKLPQVLTECTKYIGYAMNSMAYMAMGLFIGLLYVFRMELQTIDVNRHDLN